MNYLVLLLAGQIRERECRKASDKGGFLNATQHEGQNLSSITWRPLQSVAVSRTTRRNSLRFSTYATGLLSLWEICGWESSATASIYTKNASLTAVCELLRINANYPIKGRNTVPTNGVFSCCFEFPVRDNFNFRISNSARSAKPDFGRCTLDPAVLGCDLVNNIGRPTGGIHACPPQIPLGHLCSRPRPLDG
jgi:hypothetical protein